MKKIELTKGKFAIVDDEDFESLHKWNWHYAGPKDARRRDGNKMMIMHRYIMNAPKGMEVDHINGDRLDNRRSNLRICTRSENAKNRRLNVDNTSGFKGVSWSPRQKRWKAEININGKHIYLGYFKSIYEAAKAYDMAAVEFHKEYANTNSRKGGVLLL